MAVVIETTIGSVVVDLLVEERPRTCMNFVKLCKMKYYNHHLIYRIERDYIAQTGDPTGTGKGGTSIYGFTHGKEGRFYQGENLPKLKHENRGAVSMVSCGNMLFGSQFFFTLGEQLSSLDEEHLIFGEVVEGLDILSKLNQTLIDETLRPFQDIRITHTVVLVDPFPDPEGLSYPDCSPRPTADMFMSNYIHADENIDEDNDRSVAEIDEEIAAKEAETRATILEMVGDIPDADMAPPENVLFVCKLNPVTNSDDLEIIFSRFGKIKCVEVIRDKQSGNSLQYAFVEFAEPKSCEDAYFKMDNVLIDDRRIHVDFSQSVSKMQWKGKGRIEYFDNEGKRPPVSNENKSTKYAYDKKRFDNRNRSKSPNQRETNKDYRYNHRENKDRSDHRHNRDQRDERRNRGEFSHSESNRNLPNNYSNKRQTYRNRSQSPSERGSKNVSREENNRGNQREQRDRDVHRQERDRDVHRQERDRDDHRQERDRDDHRQERDRDDHRQERDNHQLERDEGRPRYKSDRSRHQNDPYRTDEKQNRREHSRKGDGNTVSSNENYQSRIKDSDKRQNNMSYSRIPENSKQESKKRKKKRRHSSSEESSSSDSSTDSSSSDSDSSSSDSDSSSSDSDSSSNYERKKKKKKKKSSDSKDRKKLIKKLQKQLKKSKK